MRFFLRGIGATRKSGSNLLSYLLFDQSFTRALIRLGYRDAMARRDELAAFLEGNGAVAQRESGYTDAGGAGVRTPIARA